MGDPPRRLRGTVTVLDPGVLTTVQDRGRPGHAAAGVPPAGPADRGAHARALRLVGAGPGAAAFETVLGGLRLRADVDLVVAAAGTSAALLVGGRLHPAGEPVHLPAGAELEVRPPDVGLRTTLAVRGGLAVPPVLGSRSTDTLTGLGPAPLRAGEQVPVGEDVDGPPRPGAGPERPPYGEVQLDVLPGPRADWTDLDRLLGSAWRVGADSDRVGTRLGGTPLPRRPGELPSEGVRRGAVQLPPDGRPVVFGPDHPTTGGYPVVAVLIPAASDRLAQCRPGTVVRFRRRPGGRAVPAVPGSVEAG